MKLSRAPSRDRYEICFFFVFTVIHILPFFLLFKKMSVCFTYMRKLGWQRQGKNEEKEEDSEMAMTINLSLTRLLFMEPFVNVIKIEVFYAASERDSLTLLCIFQSKKWLMFDVCHLIKFQFILDFKFQSFLSSLIFKKGLNFWKFIVCASANHKCLCSYQYSHAQTIWFFFE